MDGIHTALRLDGAMHGVQKKMMSAPASAPTYLGRRHFDPRHSTIFFFFLTAVSKIRSLAADKMLGTFIRLHSEQLDGKPEDQVIQN